MKNLFFILLLNSIYSINSTYYYPNIIQYANISVSQGLNESNYKLDNWAIQNTNL